MVREILQIGNPILTAPNRSILFSDIPKLRGVIAKLTETLRFNGYSGLAAPQIGENLQIFITEPRNLTEATDELRVFINPRIVHSSGLKTTLWEACGSVNHSKSYGLVTRPAEITIEAQNLLGKKFRLICNGILARITQHEYDHLFGISFTSRMSHPQDLKSPNYFTDKLFFSPLKDLHCRTTRKDFSYI